MIGHPDGMARIECQFDGDPRLIAGAATIVMHVARRAGLGDHATSDIAAATVDACDAMARELPPSSNLHGTIRLTTAEFPDHVEVSAELRPTMAAGGQAKLPPDLLREMTEKVRQRLKNAAVDEVNVDTANGMPRVTFLKSCRAAKRPFAF